MVRGSVSPFLYIWLKGKLSKDGTEGILVKKKREREREKYKGSLVYVVVLQKKRSQKYTNGEEQKDKHIKSS